MSQILKGIFGAAAVALTFGAVQLASGHDLGLQGFSDPAGALVNRAAKSDRAPVSPVYSLPTRTVSVRPISVAGTSVLIRIPVQQQIKNPAPGSMFVKSSHKPSTACEPVVSVLTEIAKRLQPGRCVT